MGCRTGLDVVALSGAVVTRPGFENTVIQPLAFLSVTDIYYYQLVLNYHQRNNLLVCLSDQINLLFLTCCNQDPVVLRSYHRIKINHITYELRASKLSCDVCFHKLTARKFSKLLALLSVLYQRQGLEEVFSFQMSPPATC